MGEDIMDNEEPKSITEVIAEFSDFSQSVASMVCGHRKILLDGGFPDDLADHMAMSLHDKLLGLVYETDPDPDIAYLFDEVTDDDD